VKDRQNTYQLVYQEGCGVCWIVIFTTIEQFVMVEKVIPDGLTGSVLKLNGTVKAGMKKHLNP
jgi:hypothetical protein